MNSTDQPLSFRIMVLSILLLPATISLAQSGSGSLIFEEDFESGFGQWTQNSQNDWFTSSQRSTSASRSAEVDGRASDAALISPQVDLQGSAEITISFSWYIESYVDYGEYIAFDISSDGGLTWAQQAILRGNADQENTWHQVSQAFTGLSSVMMRFRGRMSWYNEDANVDDIRVVADWAAGVDDAPTIAITAPADGATVSGDVLITTDAYDDIGISRVDVLIDDNLTATLEAEPYEIVWGAGQEVDGPRTISVTITDTIGQIATDSIGVDLNNIQTPPAFTSSPVTTAMEGSPYIYTLTATDPDPNDVLSFSLVSGPAGMSVNATSGRLEWLPGDNAAGVHAIEASVSDAGGRTASQAYNLQVEDAPSEVVIIDESFESGLNAWLQDSQNDWFRSTQRAVQGSSSAEIDGSAINARLTSGVIDLLGRSAARIEFSWYIESGLDGGEYIAFDVSKDAGSTWAEQARLRGNVDVENVWHEVTTELTDIASLRVRFRGRVSRSNEDANVDALKITIMDDPGAPAVDTTPPVVSILSPASSGSVTTTSTSIVVSGTASDNVGITYIAWSVNGGTATTIGATDNWSTAAIPLNVGSNNVTVDAMDAAGNAGQASLVINRENPLPDLLYGIAVIGDSNSDEYRADDDRGGSYAATTLNWVEQLANYRGLNFGTWGTRSEPRRTGYSQNWARSGATMSSMLSNGQHTGVAQQVATGDVSLVIINTGFNDFARSRYAEIYSGDVSGQALNSKIQNMIADMTTAVDTVLAAGPVSILVTNQYDYSLPTPDLLSEFPDAARRQVVTNAIRNFNAGIQALADDRGIMLVDYGTALLSVFNGIDSNGFLNVGGELIDTMSVGNEPHYMRLSDSSMHPGTILNGYLFANTLFIDVLNDKAGTSIARFSDQELLDAAGIGQ